MTSASVCGTTIANALARDDGFAFFYGSPFNIFALVNGDQIAVGVARKPSSYRQAGRSHFQDITRIDALGLPWRQTD